ncbi:hypothetical protein T459_18798 [Capsicum annuum]|uniref:Protein kinase domain-containing protein n=1 Tax=Capsicum annuum TaxID=4072 RepID=A0A2G2YZW3_CAPAN|nr:hypothetical protein T459_18798 [Capsicum annuum]
MATMMDVEMVNEKKEEKKVLQMMHHIVNRTIEYFTDFCKSNESFDFSIEPVVDGEVKHCSYAELNIITNFKDSLIQKTLTGRLFRGTIVEGSVSRPAIVKTWDYFLPMKLEKLPRLYKFCDEIELLTDERANTHPNLVKLYKCCFDRRLEAVYDAEFTRVLSDVLLDDDFGWDKRMKVATQLADLFSWLHKNGIAVGSVTADCIMIDDSSDSPLGIFHITSAYGHSQQPQFWEVFSLVTFDEVILRSSLLQRLGFSPQNHTILSFDLNSGSTILSFLPTLNRQLLSVPRALKFW